MAVPEVIAVFGPTASGKSAVAAALAERLETEVVSCDAMQVYRGLPVLTNQPASATRLVGFCDLVDEMSVGTYAPLAHEAIDEVVDDAGTVVVAGGTGLYLRAAIGELALPPAPAAGAREQAESAYDSDPAGAHSRLRELDPAAADAVHPNDRRRVVRALELAVSGSSLVPLAAQLWSGVTRRPTVVIGLDVPPAELERRIVHRVEEMFAAGVVDEVRRALEGPISRTAEKALGLREIVELPQDDARARIVVRTRRYAAYQRKWMRRIPGLVGLDATRTPDEVANAILEAAPSTCP